MATCSTSRANQHADFLVYSNLAYLAPVSAVLYRTYAEHNLSVAASLELVPFFLFVGFVTSWNYHACRSNLAQHNKIDLCENQPTFPGGCQTCPKEDAMYLDLEYNEAHLFDHIFAFYAILLVFNHALPLQIDISSATRTLGLVGIVTALMLWPNTGNDIAIAILALVAVLMLLYLYQTVHHRAHDWKRRLGWWSAGATLTTVALVMFKLPVTHGKYWLYHSLWHVFGALAGSAFILGGAQNGTSGLPSRAWGHRHIWQK